MDNIHATTYCKHVYPKRKLMVFLFLIILKYWQNFCELEINIWSYA